jgi:hypothetical protein
MQYICLKGVSWCSYTLSCVRVTIDGVWIGDSFYYAHWSVHFSDPECSTMGLVTMQHTGPYPIYCTNVKRLVSVFNSCSLHFYPELQNEWMTEEKKGETER